MSSTGWWRTAGERVLLATTIITLVVGGIAVLKVGGSGVPASLASDVLPGAPLVADADGAAEYAAGPAAEVSAENPTGPAAEGAPGGPAEPGSGTAASAPPDSESGPLSGAARSGSAAGALGAAARIDSGWLAEVSAATGIPARPLAAYAWASIVVANEQPACGLAWNTLAAIGMIESNHGRYAEGFIADDGRATAPINGQALNGDDYAAIADTDNGAWDGDPVWDRAVGPLQFIPSTWVKWGTDASGDGVADPQQVDDAAVAAARYLCASGPMTTPQGWRAAVFSYNRVTWYVDDVAAAATSYARAIRE